MENQAIIITGATSGMGYEAAKILSKSGKTLILVGRNEAKLAATKSKLTGEIITVKCDFSDLESVKSAANEIIALNVELVGLVNNAGIMYAGTKKSAQNYDLTMATNFFGPFMFTEMLLSHLTENARIEFTVSAVEDPERKFANRAGFRGGKLTTIANAAVGKFAENGSKNAGFDAYATSKQALLAYVFALAEQNPNFKINALEPGVTLGTNLGMEEQNAAVKFIARRIFPFVAPIAANFKYMSTPKKAGKLIAHLADEINVSGKYFDEKGNEMKSSKLLHDRNFCQKVATETHEFLQL